MGQKYFKKIVLLGAFAIPMSPQKWIPTEMPSRSMPIVKADGASWTLTSKDSAGGLSYILESSITTDFETSFSWSVATHPKVDFNKPNLKKNDDYALRIGFLFSGGKEDLKMPPKFKAALEKLKVKVSNVLFYCSAPESISSSCSKSPYGDQMANCLIPVGPLEKRSNFHPKVDLQKTLNLDEASIRKLSLVGLWVFADSDNSESSSEGTLFHINVGK